MKYTSRKHDDNFSLAAAEIGRLMNSQEPPIGNTAVARLIGVLPETVSSVVYRGRVPGVGLINGISRALNLDETATKKLFDLREKDIRRNRLNKAVGSSVEGKEGLFSLLEVLTASQLKEIRKLATKFAKENAKIISIN